MCKTIRVSDDTHASLAELKGDNETFDGLLSRLVEDRREAIRDGAGLWEGTNAPEQARETCRAMNKDVEMKSGDAVRVPPEATREIQNGDTESALVLLGAP